MIEVFRKRKSVAETVKDIRDARIGRQIDEAKVRKERKDSGDVRTEDNEQNDVPPEETQSDDSAVDVSEIKPEDLLKGGDKEAHTTDRESEQYSEERNEEVNQIDVETSAEIPEGDEGVITENENISTPEEDEEVDQIDAETSAEIPEGDENVITENEDVSTPLDSAESEILKMPAIKEVASTEEVVRNLFNQAERENEKLKAALETREQEEKDQEPPKNLELAEDMQGDHDYQEIYEKLTTQRTVDVFGTEDLQTVSSEKFNESIGSDAFIASENVKGKAEEVFCEKFPKKAIHYYEQKIKRKGEEIAENELSDPDYIMTGVRVRRDRQQGVFDVDLRLEHEKKLSGVKKPSVADIQKKQFEKEYPEKAALYNLREKLKKEEITQENPQEKKERKEKMLDEKRKALRERAIIDAGVFKDMAGTDKDTAFSWVGVDKIVGRPSADSYNGGWDFEYESRKGRIVDIADNLLDIYDEPENIEEVFHLKKPNERIRVLALDGPAGPIYSVEDGTHRIAGAMTAGLSEIPCVTERAVYPLEQVTTDKEYADDCEQKIKMGMIQGSVEEHTNEDGRAVFNITVEKEILPWTRIASQNDFIKVNKMYEEQYPDSLNNLSVPRDALVDPVANNYFMSGRWKEWEEKFANNQRDDKGVVIYR